MASLGSLVVSLALDTARFASDIGKSVQQMARLTAEAGKIGAAIGANIGAGITAIGALVNASVDAADRTGELAEMVGVTAEEMSRLGYAAQMSATDQETLAASMTKLAKLTADAAAGGASATAVFDSMGVSVKNADGSLRSTTEILGDISDKFATYREGTAKAALATEIFGKSGAQLIPFLNRGREGLQALGAEADMLGITLSGAAANAAGEFNDRLDQLAAAKRGLGLQIAQQLLPTINALTTRLFDSAKNADLFGRAATVAATGVKLLISSGAILVGVFQTLGQAVGGTLAAIVAVVQGRFREAWDIAKSTVIDFGGNVSATAQTVASIWSTTVGTIATESSALAGKLEAPIVKAGENAKKGATEVQKAAESYLKLSQAVGQSVAAAMAEVGVGQQLTPLQQLQVKLQEELTSGKQKFTASQRSSIEAQITWLGTLDREIAAMRELQAMARSRADAKNADYQAAEDAARANEQADRDRLRGMVGNTSSGRMEQALRDIDFLNRMLDQQKLSVDTWAEAVRNATAGIAESAVQASSTMDQFARNAAQNFQSFLGQGLYDLAEGNFSNIGAAFRQMVTRMAAEAAAADIARKLFGDLAEGGKGQGYLREALGSLQEYIRGLSAAGGGGAGGNTTGGGSNWFGALLSGIGSFFAGSGANGMYIPPGKWGWVGENGPEPAFGGKTGMSVAPAAPGAGNTFYVTVQATPGMTRQTAMQQGAQIGYGIQRAMARNN